MKDYKKEKEKFLCDNGYCTKKKISREEAMKLQDWEIEEIFIENEQSFSYKKKVPADISNEDISLIVAFKQGEKLDKLEHDMNIVKTCVIILTICTFVSILVGIIGAAEIYCAIKNFVESFSRLGF